MKVLQVSDTHLGITEESSLVALFKEASKEEFDLLLHCGDYSGEFRGYEPVQKTVDIIRQFIPTAPVLTVLGNHDYWHSGPSIHDFQQNYQHIKDCFKKANFHFLDEDGIYKHPDFPNTLFTGHSGWYKHPHPPTNDCNFLPLGVEGGTNGWMQKRALDGLYRQMETLDGLYTEGTQVCFVSHFPVVNSVADHKGSFDLFCWDENIKDTWAETYNCSYFFCGHAHRKQEGPLRYESGSDYHKPRYHIVNV